MGGDVDTIKGRLDIAEVISGYVKLEKAGTSFKARCPFHHEKTPSFFVSPARQNYYCFGCGAKGDVFSFVEDMEGLDFRGALTFLADRAGVEIRHHNIKFKEEKEKIIKVLEEATEFFEGELFKNPEALKYLKSRGISEESIKVWRIGYAPSEWRALYSHLKSIGYEKDLMLKAGLIKVSEENKSSEPYDTFRGRIIFPLFDVGGGVIAFSGRALSRDTEPKYLNSPDTLLFTKSEVLYGLDKAKDQIRKKNYAVLVEGQMDLVLSHQADIKNCVATSGTAFSQAHLERLKRFSSRIILAFDGDLAGEQAMEKAVKLALPLGFEVKVARLPKDSDPASVVENSSQEWRRILRDSLPAIEFFFHRIQEQEKDSRKLGKLIEKKILPMIKLVDSAIEQSHFISLIAKHTGIKEEVLWEDLRKIKRLDNLEKSTYKKNQENSASESSSPQLSRRKLIEERLAEVRVWQKELPKHAPERNVFKREEKELVMNLSKVMLGEELARLSNELSRAETSKDQDKIQDLTLEIQQLHNKICALDKNIKSL